jgi:hypothetical protein
LGIRSGIELFVNLDRHLTVYVVQTSVALAMVLCIDRSGDLEHVAGGVQIQTHAYRFGERYPLERLELDRLVHDQHLPPSGEQTTDINFMRRSHDIDEGRPAMGAF